MLCKGRLAFHQHLLHCKLRICKSRRIEKALISFQIDIFVLFIKQKCARLFNLMKQMEPCANAALVYIECFGLTDRLAFQPYEANESFAKCCVRL